MASKSARHEGMYFADHLTTNPTGGFLLQTDTVTIKLTPEEGKALIQDALLWLGVDAGNYGTINYDSRLSDNLDWLSKEES